MRSRPTHTWRHKRRSHASATHEPHATLRGSHFWWVASAVMLVVLGATLLYWFAALSDTLATPRAAPTVAVAIPERSHAEFLFGGQLVPSLTVRLAGVLSLREGAAAILAVGDAPARAISVGVSIMPEMKLVAVRPRSIMIEHNGIQAEITLPKLAASQPGTSPTIYVR